MSIHSVVEHSTSKLAKKSKKRVSSVEVEKAKGGYITKTRHNSSNGEYHEPEMAVHKNLSSVKSHLASKMEDTDEDGM